MTISGEVPHHPASRIYNQQFILLHVNIVPCDFSFFFSFKRTTSESSLRKPSLPYPTWRHWTSARTNWTMSHSATTHCLWVTLLSQTNSCIPAVPVQPALPAVSELYGCTLFLSFLIVWTHNDLAQLNFFDQNLFHCKGVIYKLANEIS